MGLLVSWATAQMEDTGVPPDSDGAALAVVIPVETHQSKGGPSRRGGIRMGNLRPEATTMQYLGYHSAPSSTPPKPAGSHMYLMLFSALRLEDWVS